MKCFYTLFLFFCVLGVFSTNAFADVSPEKKAVIKSLIERQGIKETALVMGAHVSKSILQASEKSSGKPIEAKQRKIIEETVLEVFKEGMEREDFIRIYYDLYDKHFTFDELQDIDTFYKTPTGAKTLKVMPVLMQDAMASGQIWAQSLLPELQKKLSQRLQP